MHIGVPHSVIHRTKADAYTDTHTNEHTILSTQRYSYSENKGQHEKGVYTFIFVRNTSPSKRHVR